MAQTFDDQLRRALDEIADRLRHDLEAHFASASQQLADAIDAERADAASVAARNAMVATEREVTDRLAAEFAARESALLAQEARVREAAYAEGLASGQQQARADLADQLAAREAELASLRASFEARLAEADQTADAHLAQARDVAEALRTAQARLAEADAAAAARADEATALRSRLGQLESEADARALSLSQEAEGRLSDARAAGDARITDELRALRDAMQVIGRAGSLSEALDALGNAVRSRADRVALFLVRDSALRQWLLAGFEGGSLQAADQPIDASDVIGEAVQRRTPRVLGGEPLQGASGRPAFAGDTPDCTAAAAVPVAMHGKVVAVLYFELTEPGSDASRLALFCELLAVHAACLLESLTVSRLVRLGAGGPLPSASYGA